ncbi:MAG: hypothetical protein QOE70_121 [Chthoniobacter sp.]|nr:hypothetical protein [Chthoniobacter sp.]
MDHPGLPLPGERPGTAVVFIERFDTDKTDMGGCDRSLCRLPNFRNAPDRKLPSFDENEHRRSETMKAPHGHAPLREGIIIIPRETPIQVSVHPPGTGTG